MAVAPASGTRRGERLREGARAWKALIGRSEGARATVGSVGSWEYKLGPYSNVTG